MFLEYLLPRTDFVNLFLTFLILPMLFELSEFKTISFDYCNPLNPFTWISIDPIFVSKGEFYKVEACVFVFKVTKFSKLDLLLTNAFRFLLGST